MKITFIQEFIDFIRQKPNFTKLLTYKYEGIKLKPNTETLILGSSHLANGYTPLNNEYNFATPSQDLYYTYNLYKKLNTPNLKNIIIAISVFTPGLAIIKTKCAKYCIPYKILLDIDYQNKDDAAKKNLHEHEEACKKEIKKYQKTLKLSENYLGNLLKYPKPKFNKEKAKARALKHYKNNQRKNSQMGYCEKIIKEAIQNNQKVFFVIPPTTEAYRKPLPEVKEIFRDLYELSSKYDNSKILNYFDTDLFNKNEFTNEDHLNKQGANKLAELIRKNIEEGI